MKKITTLFVIFFTLSSMAQNINDYKIVLIPSKFSFQRDHNQYKINTTVKNFLKQKGFLAYLSTDKLPEEFLENNCNKMYVNAIPENMGFMAKIKFEWL